VDPSIWVGIFCWSTFKSPESKSPKSKFSTNAKLGVGLGVGISGLAALCWLRYWWLTRKNAIQAKGMVGVGDGVELGDRDVGDNPPDYDSAVATEVGSLRSERTAFQPVEGHETTLDGLEHADSEEATANDGYVSPLTPVEGKIIRT
jgi:hypothetical protein